jgi:hypothetical protein
MKGDFTRDTFTPLKHFTRVLMQQGRVQLDADWNEQAAILLHHLQALASDVIGPRGGPGDGFKIDVRKDPNGNVLKFDFLIKAGDYFVDGLLCENDDDPVAYTDQDDYPLPDDESLQAIAEKNPGAPHLDRGQPGRAEQIPPACSRLRQRHLRRSVPDFAGCALSRRRESALQG